MPQAARRGADRARSLDSASAIDLIRSARMTAARNGSDARAARETQRYTRYKLLFPRYADDTARPHNSRRQWQVRRKRVGRGRGRPRGGERSASGRRARLRIAGRSTRGATRWRSSRSITASTTGKFSSNTIYYSPQLRAVFGMRDDQSLTPEESTSRLHPDDLPAYRTALVAHLKGDSAALRLRIPLSRQSRSSGAGRARAASRSATPTASPTA